MPGGAPRGRSWGEHVDKVALVLVLMLLLASAVYLLLQIRTERSQIDQVLHRQPVRMNPAEPIDFAERRAMSAPLETPFQGADATDRPLMVGEPRVMCVNPACLRPIPFHAETCPFCRTVQPEVREFPDRDGGGIPDAWEERFGLDPFNAADDVADADDDAFTNLEEFRAGADPRDPASLPPPGSKLRLVRILRQPFDRVFTARMQTEDETRFQLNSRSGRTYFHRVGDEVLGYAIVDYLPDDPAGETLLLRRGPEELRLVRGRAALAGGKAALLISLLDGARYRVRPARRLDVKGYTYVVVEIDPRGVRIRDVETGEIIEAPPVSRSDVESLRDRLSQTRPAATYSAPPWRAGFHPGRSLGRDVLVSDPASPGAGPAGGFPGAEWQVQSGGRPGRRRGGVAIGRGQRGGRPPAEIRVR